MKGNNDSIDRILAEKKDLIRLFLIAAILGFSVGGLAGLFVDQSNLPQWSIFVICGSLLLLSLALLTKDLVSTLAFEEVADAVVFFDPYANEVLPVEGYTFAEGLHRTLRAVRAESKAIYGDWEKDPLISPKESRTNAEEADQSAVQSEPSYFAVVKTTINHENPQPPKSVRLLEEATTFVLIEELSFHLSSYFNDADEDSFVKEYGRDDIPAFLLKNRVLNLLSTPIEQRDIFLSAYPNSKDPPDGEIYSLRGSDGAIFSRFDLVLPTGTTIQHSDRGGVRIETKRLALELSAVYTGFHSVISRSFAANYLGVDFEDVSPLKIAVTLKGRVKPMSLLTSSGWQYYKWLDSFRQRLRASFDFSTFQEDIHWDVIEPLLFSMRRTKGASPSKAISERRPNSKRRVRSTHHNIKT